VACESSLGVFHFFIYANITLCESSMWYYFTRLWGGFRLSSVVISCMIVKASPPPSIARPSKPCLLKLCFWCAPCIWFLKQKNVTPTFDRSVGRGLNFGNLVVMIVFRFDGGISLELSGPILIWARLTFCHFTIHPPTDGTFEESELARFLVLLLVVHDFL
jgi:hypothetical protein